MQLPHISQEYAWQIETSLHTERLGRNQVRVTLLAKRPHAMIRRVKPVLSKTFMFKNAEQRDAKIEKTAKKLWKKFQTAAYEQNIREYANYNTSAELRRALFGLTPTR